jgi:hypothetical protein
MTTKYCNGSGIYLQKNNFSFIARDGQEALDIESTTSGCDYSGCYDAYG